MSIQSIALGFMGYAYSTELEMNWIEVTNLTLKLRRLDPAFKGLRLAQVSDFHVGRWMNQDRLDRILDLALAEQPDYFILTGDYVERLPHDMSSEESIAILGSSISRLPAFCPTIAILGNHDHGVSAWRVQRSLVEAGVVVLRNSFTTIRRGNSELHIAGVDDVRRRMDRLDKVLRDLPKSGAAILLAHEPDFADTTAATGRFDAQISGHSHGGQIVFPFIGPPFLPYLGQKYPSGLYNVYDMYLYTNRGVGVTTVNARFNCRPEITIFTLEPG